MSDNAWFKINRYYALSQQKYSIRLIIIGTVYSMLSRFIDFKIDTPIPWQLLFLIIPVIYGYAVPIFKTLSWGRAHFERTDLTNPTFDSRTP